MVHSMTAYSRVESDTPWGKLTWELRSVNHRYLEVSLRLPEDLRNLEPRVREQVQKRLKRGKVDCNLRLQPGGESATQFQLDQGLLERLLQAARQVRAADAGLAPLSVSDLLGWPGVLKADAVDTEALSEAAMALLQDGMEQLVHTRMREGGRLHELIIQRLDGMEQIIARIREILPEVTTTFRERLESRLAEVGQQLDPGRLEQEVVLFAQKADVAEELDRLGAHVAEIRDVLGHSGSIGRRLDFLMQELHREANTLGSKSTDMRLINAAVDMKVLIEQIREQV